jgi:GWxTD domain-containing protein
MKPRHCGRKPWITVRLLPPCRWLLAAAAAVVASTPRPVPAAAFLIHANAFLDADRKPAVRVTAEIPYLSLVFLRGDGHFRAGYDIYLVVRDPSRSSEIVRTAVLRGEAVADDYEGTRNREKRSRPSRVFVLDPGQYTIEAVLTVEDTRIRYASTVSVVVPDFHAAGLGFGTPTVVFAAADAGPRLVSWADFASGRVAHDEDELDILDRQPVVKFELFMRDRPAGPLPCIVYYQVQNSDGRPVMYGRAETELRGETDVFALTLDAGSWEPGRYTVHLRATADGGRFDASVSVPLTLQVTRAMLEAYFGDTMETLGIVFSEEELAKLRNAAVADRASEWRALWAARDPDRATRENEALVDFLERLRVAKQRYAGSGAVWRSDRGRIYVRFGEPDKIEQVSDQYDRGEYEIWRYYGLDRVFVFYAQSVGGDYRLVEGGFY